MHIGFQYGVSRPAFGYTILKGEKADAAAGLALRGAGLYERTATRLAADGEIIFIGYGYKDAARGGPMYLQTINQFLKKMGYTLMEKPPTRVGI